MLPGPFLNDLIQIILKNQNVNLIGHMLCNYGNGWSFQASLKVN